MQLTNVKNKKKELQKPKSMDKEVKQIMQVYENKMNELSERKEIFSVTKSEI